MSNSAVNKRRLNALKNAAEALHEKDPVYKRDSDKRFIVSLIIVITLALSIDVYKRQALSLMKERNEALSEAAY